MSINELVALKIFDAKRCTNAIEANAISKDTPFVTAWWVCSEGKEKAFWWRYSNLHNRVILQPFKPETDIGDAWKVVEWLRNRWGQICIVAGISWHVYASESQGMLSGPHGSHESETMAICLAALAEARVPQSEIDAAMKGTK